MSKLQLFSLAGRKAQECLPHQFKDEKEVQHLFEESLPTLLGVRFLATEFATNNGGRMDTLGLDENNFPVIIEYKFDKNRTVINQGMFYMAWLKSHQMEYWKVVLDKFGREVADSIDFSSVRLICIATDFTREDLGAYELMPSNIDLVRYRRFGESHLLLERIQSGDGAAPTPVGSVSTKEGPDKSVSQVLEEAPKSTREIFDSVRQSICAQGDDVVEKTTKLYVAYKRIRNFASIAVNKNELLLFLHLNPDKVEMKEGMRDVRKIGHGGTGDLEIRIRKLDEIPPVVPLIQQAYEGQV